MLSGAAGCVVLLKNKLRPCQNFSGSIRFVSQRLLPRHIGFQPTQSSHAVSIGRTDEHNAVMDRTSRSGDNLSSHHPTVRFESWINDEILVLDRAVRGNFKRFCPHGNDQIRFFGKPPTGGSFDFLRKLTNITQGRTFCHPFSNKFFLCLGKASRVFEFSVLRIRVPRRHSPVVDRLHDHVSPADDLVVVIKYKWSDITIPMTLNTMRLEKCSNMTGKGYLWFFGNLSNASNQAAFWLSYCNGNWFSGKKLLNRDFQILTFHRTSRDARRILVIDSAAIFDIAILIQHDDFRRSLNFHQICDHVVTVLDDWKTELIRLGKFKPLFLRILLIAVDRNKMNILVTKRFRKLNNPTRVELCQRTLRSKEHHNRQARVTGNFQFRLRPLSI